jgi:hypothetical protein
MMLSTMFWFIWQSGFREDFLEINQSETRTACAAMFVNGSDLNEQSLSRAFQGYFLPSFDPFGKAASEETIFLEINQSETRIACDSHVF